MAAPEQVDLDSISKQILQQLGGTPYACSSLLPLASRPGNYVYRGILLQPFPPEDGNAGRSIIIKLSAESIPSNIPMDTPVSFPFHDWMYCDKNRSLISEVPDRFLGRSYYNRLLTFRLL